MPFLFADDSNLFSSGKDLSVLQNQTNEELQNISKWLKVNKLSLNIKRPIFFIFSGRKVRNSDVALNIDGISTNEEGSTKFLGVLLDNKLNWKKHIDYVSRKLSRGICMISKVKKYLNGDSLVTLYYSFIYPYMCHCNLIWGSTYESNLKKLTILQKRIIRIISGTRPKEHTDPLFEKLGLMKFMSLNKYSIGKFMFRYNIKQVPDIFYGYFKPIQDIHDHNTRSCCGLYARQPKTELSKFSISYRGPVLWNKIISTGINPETSEAIFTKYLKKFINKGIIWD